MRKRHTTFCVLLLQLEVDAAPFLRFTIPSEAGITLQKTVVILIMDASMSMDMREHQCILRRYFSVCRWLDRCVKYTGY